VTLAGRSRGSQQNTNVPSGARHAHFEGIFHEATSRLKLDSLKGQSFSIKQQRASEVKENRRFNVSQIDRFMVAKRKPQSPHLVVD